MRRIVGGLATWIMGAYSLASQHGGAMSHIIIFAATDLTVIMGGVAALVVIGLFLLRSRKQSKGPFSTSAEGTEGLPHLKQSLRMTREEGFVGRIF